MDVSTMPPHITLLSFEDDLIIMEEPRFIDFDPMFWSISIQQWLEELPDHQGFLLWCILEDSEGQDQACVVSWKRGMTDPVCVLMGLDFDPDKFVSMDVLDVLPAIAVDFNEPLITH